MSEAFSPAISNRICQHMNDDHRDALVLYAQAFGGLPNATAAELVSIDAEGMNLTATVEGSQTPIRIGFDHILNDAEDAHHTLIAMVKQARVEKK